MRKFSSCTSLVNIVRMKAKTLRPALRKHRGMSWERGSTPLKERLPQISELHTQHFEEENSKLVQNHMYYHTDQIQEHKNVYQLKINTLF